MSAKLEKSGKRKSEKRETKPRPRAFLVSRYFDFTLSAFLPCKLDPGTLESSFSQYGKTEQGFMGFPNPFSLLCLVLRHGDRAGDMRLFQFARVRPPGVYASGYTTATSFYDRTGFRPTD